MLEAIIFDYGTIVKLMEREFRWFQRWSSLNKLSFNFQKASAFGDFYRAVYSQQKKIEDIYESLSLPYDLDEEGDFVVARRKFKNSFRALPCEGIVPTIKAIFDKYVAFFTSHSGKRLRLGIKSFERARTIYHELFSHDLMKYFDTIISKEVLLKELENKPDYEKDIDKFSLGLILEKLGSKGANTLYITDNLNSLLDTYKLKKFGSEKKFERLITVGAGWRADINYLSKGIKSQDGKKIFFDKIVKRPCDLREVVETYKEKNYL